MTDSGSDTTDAEDAVADGEVARQLSNIHRTVELIALLLAVLLLGSGTVGVIVGGGAIVLLVGNAVVRAFE